MILRYLLWFLSSGYVTLCHYQMWLLLATSLCSSLCTQHTESRPSTPFCQCKISEMQWLHFIQPKVYYWPYQLTFDPGGDDLHFRHTPTHCFQDISSVTSVGHVSLRAHFWYFLHFFGFLWSLPSSCSPGGHTLLASPYVSGVDPRDGCQCDQSQHKSNHWCYSGGENKEILTEDERKVKDEIIPRTTKFMNLKHLPLTLQNGLSHSNT